MELLGIIRTKYFFPRPQSKSPSSLSSLRSTCGGVPHHERWLDHRDHLVHCLCSEAGENDENDFKYSFVAIKLRRGRKKEDHSGYKDEILIVTLVWTPRDLLHMVMVNFWFI